MFIAISIIWANSPGIPAPYLNERNDVIAGSISEKVFVPIRGAKQGMFIKSKDSGNPVLLYVHGGMPLYFLTKKYATGLEDSFTVVWWDQRGSGISYDALDPEEKLHSEQLIKDLLAVTQYLKKRFGKQKIYLMGHSGGTYIAIQAAAQNPELFYAYIGVSQMSDQLRSERIAYQHLLSHYRENGDGAMVQKLLSAPVLIDIPEAYLKIRDQAMHSMGAGTTHDMKSVITGVFMSSWLFPDYTMREKVNMWRGKARSGVHPLWTEMLSTDLSKKVPKLEIPVYFISGIYDYTVSYPTSKEYFQSLEAPVKGFYSFENSAHSPFLEEPDKMNRILKEDVLHGLVNLSDAKQNPPLY
jgi:pimeloyl-ACP methyl ester carboxylesterase